jgi:putative transposase
MYTASTLDAAELARDEFRKLYGTQYPGAVDVWNNAWNELAPFLDYPVELRKSSTRPTRSNPLISNSEKSPRTAGHFPDKDAAMKLLYLGLRNISSQRGGGSGTGTWGWKVALNTLVQLFPGRIPY